MWAIPVAIALGLIPAYIASQKGHSFGLWWLYGALLFVVALPHALLTQPGAGATPQLVSQVLDRIEARPGQTPGELATRAGLHLPQVVGALAHLKERRLVRYEKTGHDMVIGRETLPEVRVYPADSASG